MRPKMKVNHSALRSRRNICSSWPRIACRRRPAPARVDRKACTSALGPLSPSPPRGSLAGRSRFDVFPEQLVADLGSLSLMSIMIWKDVELYEHGVKDFASLTPLERDWLVIKVLDILLRNGGRRGLFPERQPHFSADVAPRRAQTQCHQFVGARLGATSAEKCGCRSGNSPRRPPFRRRISRSLITNQSRSNGVKDAKSFTPCSYNSTSFQIMMLMRLNDPRSATSCSGKTSNRLLPAKLPRGGDGERGPSAEVQAFLSTRAGAGRLRHAMRGHDE